MVLTILSFCNVEQEGKSMKIRVENGITIISTGVSSDDTKNKTGVKGLTWREDLKKYVLAFVWKGHKLHIGNFDTLEEAAAVRNVIDKKIESGDFEEWYSFWKESMNNRANKYGVAGLSKRKNKYQLAVNYNKKRHYIGSFDNIEEPAKIRKEIDIQLQNGTFEKWYEEWEKTHLQSNIYGVSGLTKTGKSYQLNIKHNHKNIYIGRFKTIESAALIRNIIDQQLEAGTFDKWYEEYKNK